jgi:TrmH family RNA methyltransferase
VKRIESPANELVKKIRRLGRDARARRREILLEGWKLLEAALESGVGLRTVVLASRATRETERIPRGDLEIVEVDDGLFQKLTTVSSPEGILAVAARPSRPLDELSRRGGAILVADQLRDPGNLGAIARVAEAAGIDGLVVVKGSVDPFAPKALRGSMGSLLRLPLFEIDEISLLSRLPFRFAALAPRGGTDFRAFDWTPPIAVLLGSESRGLSPDASALSPARVTIPMKGAVESLNVATAAALVAYEATRPKR